MTQAVPVKSGLILTQSKPLRMLTLFLFYLTQGAPVGVFFYAIPAWMAGNGASAADTAWVLGFAMLPWSLKLVNGFIIDRYTFLPMGRRRAWVIGAQLLVATALLIGGVLDPSAGDLVKLAAIGFIANLAVTYQDVGIDSLAIDIMPEEERAKAGSIMFGAQVIGIAGTTAMTGYLLDTFGFQLAMAAAAAVPILVAIFGICILEREGESRLPWQNGTAHPHNVAIQIDAWWPLLKKSFAVLIMPLSLIFLPILFLRAVPYGAFEAFHPVLAQQTAGWSISEYTNLVSISQFSSGVAGLVVGAWLVEKMGAQRAVTIYMGIGAAMMLMMGLSPHLWPNSTFLTVIIFAADMIAVFATIAIIPIAMRMCSPAVAATQFTIYMACANFGRPLGAWVSGMTAGQGNPTWLYLVCAAAWIVVIAILLLVRFPDENRQEIATAEELPHGDGIPARIN